MHFHLCYWPKQHIACSTFFARPSTPVNRLPPFNEGESCVFSCSAAVLTSVSIYIWIHCDVLNLLAHFTLTYLTERDKSLFWHASVNVNEPQKWDKVNCHSVVEIEQNKLKLWSQYHLLTDSIQHNAVPALFSKSELPIELQLNSVVSSHLMSG